MKKLLILSIFAFILCGCGYDQEFECTVDGKPATIGLKEGFISSYTLDGKKVSQAEIDEINGTYFTGVANEEQSVDALGRYLLEVNGNCNFNVVK